MPRPKTGYACTKCNDADLLRSAAAYLEAHKDA